MTISPEFEFLLDCLKLRNEGNLNFSPAKENIDWQKWKELLIKHGVLIQVYMNLTKENKAIPTLPGKVREELKSLFHLNTSRNIMVCSQLNILVKTMQTSGEKITVIPFKGPVLALQAYNDWAYRSYSDLDVLIDKNDFSRFYDHMTKLGYQPLYPCKESVRKWWAALGREYVFSKKDIHVDVHFRIQRGPGFVDTANTVFSEGAKIKVLDHWVECLSLEYSLLAICINGTRDGWHRLCYITDLAYLVWNNRGLKWNSLVLAARKMKVYTMLCIGLKLSNEFLGLQLPEEIRQDDIETAKVVKLSRIYSNNLKKGNVLQKKFSAQILEIKTVDTVWGKFRYFCYYLFVPKISDLEAVSITGFLFPLYFFLRPLMLLIRMFRRLV
ncbi:MAG: hypothetical protein GTO45_36630 [Candidatus Aminicenantes bacterium]|nr:hypothetical protein [Candidatus Aminicenantes bacterium]NIM84229.1 hypothetical protein [Candidatus Aminicenantes bacterium]NIN23678.1 hypothetical protein [Candidatus Aminicenantes bacterium]NIN47385.1 hypothetical protein [Candidatus Aminicenantes bacterium]NIN90313.1 hypothetical protein [Candidatus Aminicenantes bacterium]